MAYRYLLSGLLILFALTAADWLSAIEIPLFIMLVGTIGILHGSLDHQVAFRYFGMQSDRSGWIMFLGGYLGIMLVYGALWYVLPLVALIIFLVLSVWHFGQSDLHTFTMEGGQSILNVTRSSAVLGVMFGMHITDVQEIVKTVMPLEITADSGYIIALGSLLIHLFAVIWYKPQPLKMALFDIVWLSLVSTFLPLLLAFAVYFTLWHSLSHLSELRDYLDYDRWTKLIWNGLPFTVLALILVVGFATLLPSGENHTDWVLFLFIAISLMTMPHMLLVDKMLKHTD